MNNAFKTVNPRIFADDTSLFFFEKDIDKLFDLANSELSLLEDWLLANKLSLNIGADKETKFLFFTHSKMHPDIQLPQIKMYGVDLPQACSIRYLGLIIDEKLDFKVGF